MRAWNAILRERTILSPRVLLYNLDPPGSTLGPLCPLLPTFLDPDVGHLDASGGCFPVTCLLCFLVFPETGTLLLKLGFVFIRLGITK